MAALVSMVVWVDAGGRGLGTCGHRHGSAEARLCLFELGDLPDAYAGLVREVRDPDYRVPGERSRAHRLKLSQGETG